MTEATQRTMAMAGAIAAPALVVALGLTAIEAYRLVSPRSPLFAEPPAASLADAITDRRGVEQAYAFIRAGQDPNEPIAVNVPEYTDGRAINVSPLMLAVAARDSNVVLMLLNFGARLDLPQNKGVACLAREIGDELVVRVTSGANLDEPEKCPERRSTAATPLLAWLE